MKKNILFLISLITCALITSCSTEDQEINQLIKTSKNLFSNEFVLSLNLAINQQELIKFEKNKTIKDNEFTF